MSFALRHGEHDYPLGEGRFIIGRSESCQLCLNDPMASRNHAALTVVDGRVLVQDLQSRNGVFVNQERVTDSMELSNGDVIRIGGEQMTLIRRGGRGRAETLVQKPVTAKMQAFGVLGGLAQKALTLGHGEEAERILGRQLEQFLDKIEGGGQLSDEEFERSVHYALKIGSLTKKGKWLDYLFRIHTARGQLMDAEVVNELYSVSKKMTGSTPARLRAYLEVLSEHTSSYGPGERFVLKRIEGLEAQLA